MSQSPIPSGATPAIVTRSFQRSDVKVSALAMGGHHLGDAEDLKTAKQIVHEGIDGGITFFDNCWEYHRGKTEDWMGQALKGRFFADQLSCRDGVLPFCPRPFG